MLNFGFLFGKEIDPGSDLKCDTTHLFISGSKEIFPFLDVFLIFRSEIRFLLKMTPKRQCRGQTSQTMFKRFPTEVKK